MSKALCFKIVFEFATILLKSMQCVFIAESANGRVDMFITPSGPKKFGAHRVPTSLRFVSVN